MIAGHRPQPPRVESPQAAHRRNVRNAVSWAVLVIGIAGILIYVFTTRPNHFNTSQSEGRSSAQPSAGTVGSLAVPTVAHPFHSARRQLDRPADAAVGAGKSIPTPTAFLTPHQPRASANAVTTATLTMVRPGTSSNRGILVSS